MKEVGQNILVDYNLKTNDSEFGIIPAESDKLSFLLKRTI